MMLSSPQRGLLWRFALGMLAFAIAVLGASPAALASEPACACPCERAESTGVGDVARRPGCCPGPDEQVEPVPAIAPAPEAGATLVGAPVVPARRVLVHVQHRAPRPHVRGPPSPPPTYLIHRSLLL